MQLWLSGSSVNKYPMNLLVLGCFLNHVTPILGIQARPLSFSQWQVWAILLLAGCSGYLSLMLHYVHKDQLALNSLIAEVSDLDTTSSQITANPQRWLIDANELLPRLGLFKGDTTRVKDQLSGLTERITAGATAGPRDQIQIKQNLSLLLSELRSRAGVLALKSERTTHYYYLSVIGFVLALGALLVWRLKLRSHSLLDQLMSDKLLFSNIPVALSLSDADDRLLRANGAFEELTGFSNEEMRGETTVCEDSDEERSVAEKMRRDLTEQGRWIGEYRMRSKDGSVQAEKVMRMSLGDDWQAPEGFLTMSMETTHSDAEQRLMLWQAHHDNLTKLPNANLLNERLMRETQQEGRRGAVISIDLDNFKVVNDSLGHAGADRVLIEAAHRIAMCAREADTVARKGGDLFVIAMAEIEDIAEVERIARAAVEAVAQSFHVGDDELFINASAGVTIFPDDGKTPGELLQKSDAARLNAKSRGGNQVMFFEDQMNTVAARRFELETHLRKAIAGQEFELFFQPVIDISRDEVYGAEALLRWHSPELGFISPVEFIPVAEDTGLIVDIGRWVVVEVQRHLRLWQTKLPGLRISLNVSARQLVDEEQTQELLEILSREFTQQITVELTESALVDDEPGALMFLKGLRALNLQVALDDFGTGYSSVGYLRDYEFDVLKVDKSFIDGIDGVRDLGLVASIVAMGRILGMRVVAEGVEEEAQLERLKRIGCDFVQGYFYSKPLPVAEFEDFVIAYGKPEDTQNASGDVG
jgi:diguanylate cyclase (GGDEF)-like protein/PAS domain S-box-containing protein